MAEKHALNFDKDELDAILAYAKQLKDNGSTGSGSQGPKGDTGATGANGLSAYEVYKSTIPAGETVLGINDWLKSLKGEKGEKGVAGPTGPKGVDGIIGRDGATGPTGPAPKLEVEMEVQSVNIGTEYRPEVTIEDPDNAENDAKLRFTFPANMVILGTADIIESFDSVGDVDHGTLAFNKKVGCLCIYDGLETRYSKATSATEAGALTVVDDSTPNFSETTQVKLTNANKNARTGVTFTVGEFAKPETVYIWYKCTGEEIQISPLQL